MIFSSPCLCYNFFYQKQRSEEYDREDVLLFTGWGGGMLFFLPAALEKFGGCPAEKQPEEMAAGRGRPAGGAQYLN